MEHDQTPSGRERMVARAVAYVRSQGLPREPSLRKFAEALGTSHRMLAYYFGSLDGMLATILHELRAADQEALLAAAASQGLREASLSLWAYYVDDARRPEHEAFFHVLSAALHDRTAYEQFLGSLDAWVRVTTDIAIAGGADPQTAAAQAELLVAAMRGLLMDRLVSTSPERVDAAFRLMVDRLVPDGVLCTG